MSLRKKSSIKLATYQVIQNCQKTIIIFQYDVIWRLIKINSIKITRIREMIYENNFFKVGQCLTSSLLFILIIFQFKSPITFSQPGMPLTV